MSGPTDVPLVVLAPLGGVVLALAQVPDPVFGAELVGPGLAVDPARGGRVDVVSPVSGTIVKLHPHAFVVTADASRSALVHLGLDTVQLGGAGFTLHVREGDVVAAGDVVISWHPGEVADGGRSPVCPVVALEGKPGGVRPLCEPGATVQAGEPLFAWS